MGGNFLFWLLEGQTKCSLIDMHGKNISPNHSLKWRVKQVKLRLFHVVVSPCKDRFWKCFKALLSSLEENLKPDMTTLKAVIQTQYFILPQTLKSRLWWPAVRSQTPFKKWCDTSYTPRSTHTSNSWDDEQLLVLIMWHEAQPIWKCKHPPVLVFKRIF